MSQQATLPIRHSAGIIIDDGSSWILQKRDNKDGILWPGKIALWGGVRESQDENNPIKNAWRELFEETGLTQENTHLVRYGGLEFEHQPMHQNAVTQTIALFVANISPDVFFHVYEGQDAYKIPRMPDMSQLDTTHFAPYASEAIEKLIDYFLYAKTET